MSKVTFTVGTNRGCRFTNAQLEKVNQAIQILDKCWNSPQFKKAVCDHNWTAENGTTYNRFHMCNGMSNEQVWDCIWNGWNAGTGSGFTNNVITVMPCASWSDYNYCINSGVPCVCVNVNYVNCDWYTPVHIASCIMYEYCVNCCGFTGYTNANAIQCWNNTVPAACSTILRDCCMEVCTDMNVSQWANFVNTPTYNCYPCCMTWGVNNNASSNFFNTCNKVNEAISAMQFEIDCLNNVANKSTDEVNRLTMMTSAVESMTTICNKMYSTSLDGCEFAWMPAVNAKNVVTG